MYKVTNFQGDAKDTSDLQAWIEGELAALEQSFFDLNMIQLVETNVAPAKPRTGMVVLADGTNWNPGSGAGFYGYRGGSWRLLG